MAASEHAEIDRRLRGVERDFAEHDGRSATFWEDQTRTNTATLRNTEKLHERISAESQRTDTLEKKFSWVWGVAAGVTGLLAAGAAIAKVLL